MKPHEKELATGKGPADRDDHKPAQPPVGIVTGAMRPDQRIENTTLGELHTAVVNMQSIVFIGNRSTRRYGDFLLTLRGYGEKYRL